MLRPGWRRARWSYRQAVRAPICSLGSPFRVEVQRFPVHDGSMQQAIIDPEQVRRFAEELQRFNRDIQHRLSSMQARFAALGDSWQDQEHAKFAEEFKH